MFAGFFLNDNNVPVGMIWLKYISFFRYTYLALIQNEFTDINGCKFADGEPNLCLVPENKNANLGVWWYILILAGEGLFVKIMAYMLFTGKMRKYTK
jgi:hypothetical protein